MLITSWRPKLRNITYQEKPDFVPEDIYKEAQAAKNFYNRDWEFWVFAVSQEHNCPVPEAEDACIRGLKKALLLAKVVYGDRVGKWYEEFLDMGDIFQKVKHPTYLKHSGVK